MATNLKNKPLKKRMLALGLLSATFLPVATHAQTDAPTPQQARYEVWFLGNMIDHHAAAIQAANMAPQRTDNPVILQASSSILATRPSEMQTMQNWLQSWYGMQYSPSVNATAMLNGMNTRTDDAFDYAFARTIWNLNNRSIAEAQRAQNLVWHWDLANAAQTIATQQSTEIQEINSWTPGGGYPSGPFDNMRRLWNNGASYTGSSYTPGMGVPTGPFDNMRRLWNNVSNNVSTIGVPSGPFDNMRRLWNNVTNSVTNSFTPGTGVPSGPFNNMRRLW